MGSKSFTRLTYITLVFIILVMLAGSVVRSTGAGMGCPDWPKCFDCIIPPTSEEELPDNYQEIYSEYRQKKVEKFAKFLVLLGMESTAQNLLNDPNIYKEEPFNARKTWTEYINRLVGFVAGNLVLILLIWSLIKYRTNRKLIWLAFLNLILMGIEAWFGSIVVATNLVPWTITVHMFLALIIVAIQIRIIRIAEGKTYHLKISKSFKNIFYFSLMLTFIQIILGAQVRQEVDFLVKESIDRAAWIHNMPGDFLFHRSFSWLLLAVNFYLFYLNRKNHYGLPTLLPIVIFILIEFITGVLFSYANMPVFGQPIHMLTATLLFTFQLYSLQYFKRTRNSLLA